MKKIAVASIAYLALLLATAFPSWIERITGSDPDGRDGSAELFIAVASLILAGLTFAVPVLRRRRAAQKRGADARTKLWAPYTGVRHK